jgi:hypothetical protein
MTCPVCGRYGVADGQTGYEAASPCPSCWMESPETCEAWEAVTSAAPPDLPDEEVMRRVRAMLDAQEAPNEHT